MTRQKFHSLASADFPDPAVAGKGIKPEKKHGTIKIFVDRRGFMRVE